MLPFVLLDSLEHTLCGAGAASWGVFEHLSGSAATLAVTAMWQGIAVAAALTIVLRLLPRLAAAERFALWLAAFWAVVGLPILPLFTSTFSTTLTSLAKTPAAHPWFALDARWSLGIAALWALASLFRAAGLVRHSFRLAKMWRAARAADVPALAGVASSGILGRRFEVCTVPGLDRPSVIGFLRPRILVPDWLFPCLTPEELEQIILHEFEHLRRRDDWTNLLQKISLALFPLNPALWFIESRLGDEREMACDEAVVRITRAPRAYAACLTSLAERGQERRAEALSLGAWQRRSELVHRVQSILRSRRGLGTVPARILVGAIASSVLVVTLALARCPQLVAFVPPARSPGQRVVGAGQLGDALYPAVPGRGQELARYFAQPAKAVMTPVPLSQAPRSRGVGAATGELRASATSPVAPASPSPLRSKSAHAHHDSGDAQEQFVIFTAWEQVDASAGVDNRIADYDAGGRPDATNSSGDITGAPNTPAPSRVTLTRLIFRVLPTGSTRVLRSGAKPGISLPATIPFGDGWLVLQL